MIGPSSNDEIEDWHMELRQVGNSDLKVSAVSFGAWAIGGLFWGGAEERESIAAIHRAIDEGVTTIDTAPIYGCGYSEEVVGKAIRGRRDQVQILTKFSLRWDTGAGTHFFDLKAPNGRDVCIHKLSTAESVIGECEESLKRLGVDCIDLYQHHWPDPATPIEETFSAVDKLLRDGKIRCAGVSNYSVEQMETARKVVPIVSNQPPYSMLRRAIEPEIVPYCLENNIALIGYSPLMMGLLTGKVTEDREFPETDVRSTNKMFTKEVRRKVNAFLARLQPIADAHGVSIANVVVNWTIHQPGITAALVGARNPAQSAENARAASFRLSDEEWAFINGELSRLDV
jgi:aryl-alcohol dehydrogenase-like predicted oxidoreductase